MLQQLRRSWRAFGDERPARVLIGFSGGADSLTLLSLIANLGRHEGFAVQAIHVDHGVRNEAVAEIEVVRSVARSLDVELHISRVSAEGLMRHAGVGREEAMRRERYRAFAHVAAEVDAGLVALAHHQRDQAETVLLHLLRGSGIRGAAGMRPVSSLTVPWWDEQGAIAPALNVRIWRPLLGESATTVRAFADSLGLPIVEDASNADVAYRRNAIRHDALPVLERIAPGAVTNLARFADLAAVDSDELDRRARMALNDAGNPQALDRQWLLGLPRALQRRVIQFWILAQSPVGLEVPLNRIENVLRVASRRDRPRLVEIGAGVAVEVARKVLVLRQDG